MKKHELFERNNRKKSEFPFYTYTYASDTAKNIFTPHWHNEIEMTVATGSGTVKIENKVYTYETGDIIVVPGGFLHTLFCDGPTSYKTLLFDISMLHNANDYRFIHQSIVDIDMHKLFIQFIIKPIDIGYMEIMGLFESLYCCDDLNGEEKQLLVMGCLFQLLYLVKKNNLFEEIEGYKKDGEIDYVKQSIYFMENNRERSLKVIDICHYVNLSEGYFTRIFKKQMMTTPIQYLNDLRLYHAKQELVHGVSVTDVALANGFADVSYFIKQYKGKYGYTPKKTLQANEYKKDGAIK